MSTPCRNLTSTGFCKFGASCKFRHDDGLIGKANTNNNNNTTDSSYRHQSAQYTNQQQQQQQQQKTSNDIKKHDSNNNNHNQNHNNQRGMTQNGNRQYHQSNQTSQSNIIVKNCGPVVLTLYDLPYLFATDSAFAHNESGDYNKNFTTIPTLNVILKNEKRKSNTENDTNNDNTINSISLDEIMYVRAEAWKRLDDVLNGFIPADRQRLEAFALDSFNTKFGLMMNSDTTNNNNNQNTASPLQQCIFSCKSEEHLCFWQKFKFGLLYFHQTTEDLEGNVTALEKIMKVLPKRFPPSMNSGNVRTEMTKNYLFKCDAKKVGPNGRVGHNYSEALYAMLHPLNIHFSCVWGYAEKYVKQDDLNEEQVKQLKQIHLAMPKSNNTRDIGAFPGEGDALYTRECDRIVQKHLTLLDSQNKNNNNDANSPFGLFSLMKQEDSSAELEQKYRRQFQDVLFAFAVAMTAKEPVYRYRYRSSFELEYEFGASKWCEVEAIQKAHGNAFEERKESKGREVTRDSSLSLPRLLDSWRNKARHGVEGPRRGGSAAQQCHKLFKNIADEIDVAIREVSRAGSNTTSSSKENDECYTNRVECLKHLNKMPLFRVMFAEFVRAYEQLYPEAFQDFKQCSMMSFAQ